MPLTRTDLERLAISGYFGNVAARRISHMLAIIADDAVMEVATLGIAYRGKAAIAAHFDDFLNTYARASFSGFAVTADSETQTVAVRFAVRLERHDGGEAVDMQNCNIFEVDPDGHVTKVVIYMSAALQEGFQQASVSR